MCSSVELSKHRLDVDPQAHQEHLVSFAIDVVRQLVIGPLEGGSSSLHELKDLLFGYLHFAPFLISDCLIALARGAPSISALQQSPPVAGRECASTLYYALESSPLRMRFVAPRTWEEMNFASVRR